MGSAKKDMVFDQVAMRCMELKKANGSAPCHPG